MTYFMRRLLGLVPTLLGISLLTFLMMHAGGGDPVAAMLGPEATEQDRIALTRELGFDQPLPVQYLRWLGVLPRPVKVNAPGGGTEEVVRFSGVIQGDFGRSITTQRPVWEEIAQRLPATLELGLAALFFATITSLLVGILSAVNPRGAIDGISRFAVFVFLAMPSFWLGLELIIIFSRWLQWFPPGGRGTPFTYAWLGHLVLPAITLGVGTGAFLCRILRSSMLEVLSADYIRTGRAKGLSKWVIVMKHALKNAMIPFITVAGISAGSLLGGSIIVEAVFNWPGVGRLLVTSIFEYNFPVTIGCVFVLATIFVLVNLLVDFSYSLLDPRIRVGAGGGEAR